MAAVLRSMGDSKRVYPGKDENTLGAIAEAFQEPSAGIRMTRTDGKRAMI